MRTLSIAAPGNTSGKTGLACALCRAFPGRLDVVKFTTVYKDGQFCPRDASKQCACRELTGEFSVCEERDVVERPETDTGRIALAGARKAHWAIGRPDSYKLLWPHLVEKHFPEDARVITEGNTAAAFVGADLLVFLFNPWVPRENWKDNAWRILAGADVVVTNAWHPDRGYDPEGAPKGLLEKTGRMHPLALLVEGDVSQPVGSWKGGPEFLEKVRQALDL
jgi:hypothetical protein